MKILIAYDGSQPARNAIAALTLAGLPEAGVHAKVISVGEADEAMEQALNLDPGLPIVTHALESAHESVMYACETAESEAEEGVQAVLQLFPRWDVTSVNGNASHSRIGSPASTILEVAESWKPGLIVMGSHGRSGFSRLFLGSVSLRVMREAKTSVRITRNEPERIASGVYPPILMLAFDGSPGSEKAARHLLDRQWPDHTRIHIVAVIDVSILSTRNYLWLVGEDLKQYQDMNESRIEHDVHSLEREMRKASPTMGFEVTSALCVGNPVHEILAEAKRIQADTIFIGSRRLSHLEQMLLGSVAHEVVAHAEATVEIVK